MSRVSALTHDAPGLYAANDPASIFDDADKVRDALMDAGIPDYLASALADVAMAGWSDAEWLEAKRYVQRHVQPILIEADQ